MNDHLSSFGPVRPRSGASSHWTPVRAAGLAVVVGFAALLVGMQIGASQDGRGMPSPSNLILQSPQPTPSIPPRPTPSNPPLSTPSISQSNPPASDSAPFSVPTGVFHLTQTQADVIAQAARFYAAYNAGELTTVMSTLSANPTLSDCDYQNRALVSINGRPAIENYLRARFADHDRWTVELYQERPTESRQIVIVPLQRQSGMLLKLGAAGGVKRSFAVLLSLQFEQEQRNIDMIQWGTVMGPTIERELCSP